MKLSMVHQNDVTLKPIRFEKPSVKMIFDVLTQRYWGNVDIYINTPLSDILYCISHSISPYIKTHLPAHYPHPWCFPLSQRRSCQSRNAAASTWGLDVVQKLPPTINTYQPQHCFQTFSKMAWKPRIFTFFLSRSQNSLIGNWLGYSPHPAPSECSLW